MSSPFKILLAPLDWGLGHTTRCFPIIDYCLRKGHEIKVAAPNHILKFIQQSFPNLPVLELKGYQISYSQQGRSFTLKLLRQIPKILSIVKQEHQWLKEIQEKEQFDLIISDNRYGLYHPKAKSIIMTHQLEIQSEMGQNINRIIQKLHYKYLEKFDQCWVVDEEGNKHLAGKLSHPKVLPNNVHYIGLLSQFSILEKNTLKNPNADKTNILILLSGPEPSRSILENKLEKQITDLPDNYQIHLVAGDIRKDVQPHTTSTFSYYPKLSAKELLPLLQDADLVVCRSGYSTLMDMAFMNKKVLLIPTPGQTEQEYLAGFLQEKFQVFSTNEQSLNLKEQIPIALENPSLSSTYSNNSQNILEKLFTKLSNKKSNIE